ncbi:multicopper oxidase [Aulographum hederae CBS 113979]|uniref:Multicopper oxidase n=1 Tax=Aulographum hederae CBS 113979 TaxID=1176131 RepID=A0A6G1GRD8_9PEZI|nr:multicopper oxidase [Aulographum hederae CBS 113979]
MPTDQLRNRRSFSQLQDDDVESNEKQSFEGDGFQEQQVKRSTVRRLPLWISVIGLITFCAVLGLYFSQLVFFPELLFSGNSESSGKTEQASRGQLNISLHPELHTDRPAKAIHHQWRVSSEILSPDGVSKRIYLVNDAFPGPTIEARCGDTLIIDVENALDNDEGFALHWHGLSMRNANDMDGAVGFTQDPIPAGGKFTYQFRIGEEQYGTFWWHAHHQEQRGDGMYGALIVHRPAETVQGHAVAVSDAVKYGYDEERVLMIGDWYHRPAEEVLGWYLQAASFGNEPVPDSLLINGLGAYNCSMAVRARPVDCMQIEEDMLPNLNFDRTKKYRLRLVDVGSLAGFTIDFPDAELTVIEVDGGNPVQQETARSVGILHPGQRVDAILSWKGLSSPSPRSHITITLDDENFNFPNPALTEVHSFPINLSGPVPPVSSSHTKIPAHFDLSNVTSATPITIPFQASQTILLYSTVKKLAHLSNIPYGFFNHTTYLPQSTPPGPLISLPRSSWDSHQFVPYIPYSPSTNTSPTSSEPLWIDLIINNLDDGPHPFHLHGYSFYVLQNYASGWGWGSYNPFEDAEPPGGPLDLTRAVRRDTVVVPMRGYAVLRFRADNPGIWMLHCHMLWHQAGGMVMGLQVGGQGDDGGV